MRKSEAQRKSVSIGQKRRAAQRTKQRRRRLRVESLEARHLLAADLGILRDFVPGPDGSYPHLLGSTGQRALIGTGANELWTSDGTPEGTTRVATDVISVAPHLSFGDRGRTAALGDRIFFAGWGTGANESQDGPWVSDGTESGTFRIGDPQVDYGAEELAATASHLFFVGPDELGRSARTLWTIDAGDLSLDSVLQMDVGGFSSSFRALSNLTTTDDRIYFTAFHTESGRELWTSDGTAPGTVQLRDFVPGLGSSSPQHITTAGNRVAFIVATGSGSANWAVSDGTTQGTELLDLTLHWDDNLSGVRPIVSLGDQAYFLYEGDVWTTDGTTGGTFRLLEDLADKDWLELGGTRVIDRVVLRLVSDAKSPGQFDLYQHDLSTSSLTTAVPKSSSSRCGPNGSRAWPNAVSRRSARKNCSAHRKMPSARQSPHSAKTTVALKGT